MNQHPHNILIIKPGAIGDLLQLTPVVRALHGKFPQAGIFVLVGSAATATLFQHDPLVQGTIIFDKRGEHRSPLALAKLWLKLYRLGFDLVINFQRSNVKSWFLASAAFPCRTLVYHKAGKRIVHAVVNHLETLAPLHISADDTVLEMHPGPTAEDYAVRLAANEGWTEQAVIALNPGASHPVNRWGVEKFAQLADRLAEQLSTKVVIVGGKEDRSLADEIAGMSRTKPLILAGQTDLLQLGAVLRKCAILVSGDTGPMHMATAVGTRVVALFGAADPARTGPVGPGHRVIQAAGIDCVPCRSRRCTNKEFLQCMEKITVTEVFDAVAAMLAEGRQ